MLLLFLDAGLRISGLLINETRHHFDTGVTTTMFCGSPATLMVVLRQLYQHSSGCRGVQKAYIPAHQPPPRHLV